MAGGRRALLQQQQAAVAAAVAATPRGSQLCLSAPAAAAAVALLHLFLSCLRECMGWLCGRPLAAVWDIPSVLLGSVGWCSRRMLLEQWEESLLALQWSLTDSSRLSPPFHLRGGAKSVYYSWQQAGVLLCRVVCRFLSRVCVRVCVCLRVRYVAHWVAAALACGSCVLQDCNTGLGCVHTLQYKGGV